MWGYKYPGSASGGLQLEITAYKETGNGKALISGTLSGKFVKVLGKGEMTVENGVFTDIPVDVYTEVYLK